MLDPDLCYAAIQARDPRQDGLFFTAVKTTRIYCRPICPARAPLRKNVAFYGSAAQAQEAGYRPCLRCRPESAPDSPAWIGSLASVNRALRLIEEGALVEAGVEALAARLGVTGRHLRRLFEQHLGVGPLQVEQTRRINLAKTLLHETGLSMTQIAFAAGFSSLRRFNEAFAALFGRPPTTVRRDAGGRVAAEGRDAPLRLTLTYRPPFDWPARVAEHAASESAAGGSEHGRIEGGVYRATLPLDGREAQITVAQGAGRTVTLELRDVPIRHLARMIVRAKRDILFGADDFGADDFRPDDTQVAAEPPLASLAA